MDITLLSYGSRGDVQPYLALACALRHVGHHVRLVAPPDFASLAREHQVHFYPAGVNLQAHLKERSRVLAQSGKSMRSLRTLRNELRSIMDDVARDTWDACQGTELLIGVGPASYSVAQKLDVPFIEAAMQPVTPTRAFPSPVVPDWLPLGDAGNRLSHVLFEQLFWQLFRANTNRLRTEVLGLPPFSLAGPLRRIREHGLLRLYAYSSYVVPRPEDWPAHHQVTGYWFLPPPADWQPPPELTAFLAAGPAPVYIGFGSMLGQDPRKTTALLTEALARSGQRGVLTGGWGALGDSIQQAEHLFFIDSVPHHWLFPQMAAIVHHGGAGTTGAALRSSVPSIVVPFGFDQPFWGHRVASLGVGPQPIPRARLTAQRLADAIAQTIHNPRMREQAAQLGQHIHMEHGTAQAIDHIHRVLGLQSV